MAKGPIPPASGSVPVLFFQAGDARHLPYTFWQARHWAGDSPLILLGDKSNRHYRGLEHVPIRDFASSVPRLRDRYVHISSNTPDFEFFCLARWLVIEEFARRQGLKEFLYLDSDVLIYEKPAEIVSRIPDCRMGIAWLGETASPTIIAFPAVTYFYDQQTLKEVEDIIFEFYQDQAQVNLARDRCKHIVSKKMGGISDMWFLGRVVQKNSGKVFNLWDANKNGVIDINIFQAQGFRCKDGLKQMQFQNYQPYGYHEPTGQWVRFASLHFGGHSKKRMKDFLGRPKDMNLKTTLLAERFHKLLRHNKSSSSLLGMPMDSYPKEK